MNSTTNMATLHNGLRPRKKPSKILQNFFLQSCTRKLQILLTRESTILSFLSFFTLVSSKFAAYISEQFMLMKKCPFMYFSLLNGLLRIVNYEFFWHNLKYNCLMCCVLFGQLALLCLCGNRTVKQWSQKMFKAKLVLKDRRYLHVFLRVGQAI